MLLNLKPYIKGFKCEFYCVLICFMPSLVRMGGFKTVHVFSLRVLITVLDSLVRVDRLVGFVWLPYLHEIVPFFLVTLS